MSDIQPKHRTQLTGIQYLRGLAAFVVILDHVTGMSQKSKYFGDTFIIFNNVLISGTVGVHLFFVISGFIIVYVSLNEQTLLPKISVSSFLSHRFYRIVPFLWVCVIGTIILKTVSGVGTFPVWDYIRSFTLFPVGNVEPQTIWTLRHEFLFYGLFSLLMIRWRRNWFLMTIWFVSPFLWYGLKLNLLLPIGFLRSLLNFTFSGVNVVFGFGFLLGILFLKDKLSGYIYTKHGFLLCVFLMIPLLMVSHRVGLGVDGISLLANVVCGIIALLVVAIGVTIQGNEHENALNRFGLLLGNASYSIYLTHSATLSSVLGIWSKVQIGANPTVLLFATTAIAIIVGILTHFLVEKPLIKFIKKRSNKFMFKTA